jgi:hypothetical protein
MTKSNDTFCDELTIEQLDDISGGYDASKNEVAIETVTKVTKMEWGPISFEIG